MIAEEIKKELGEGYEVTEQDVTKNNGVTLHGVAIRRTGKNIAPTIYYKDTDDNPVESVLRAYKASVEHRPTISMDDFTREQILAKAFPVLVNRTLNAELLTHVPHKPWNDLEIIYKMDFGFGTATLTNELAQLRDITLEDLADCKTHDVVVQSLKAFMENLAGHEIDNVSPFYIVTNKTLTYATGAILDPEVLHTIETVLGDTFLVLPSSVNEFLIMPPIEDTVPIAEMVRGINTTVVGAENFLSDSIYRYSKGEWEVIA